MPSQRLINYVLPVLAVFFLALAVVLMPAPVFAQALPVGVSPVYAPTVSGNVVTYAGGTATAANASSIAFPNPANGPVYASSTQSLNVGEGRSVPVTVRSRPSAGAIAKAVGTFATKVVGVIAVGKALYDLCNELGYNCSRSAETGPITVTKPPEATCGAAYCDVYILSTNYGRYEGYTPASVCQKFASGAGFTYASSPYPFCYVDTPTGRTSYYMGKEDNRYVGTPQPVPSTIQALEDAIAAKSGWPDSSSISRVLPEVIASGIPLELPTPYQVTGPESVPLAPSVTSFPDGSSVTDSRTKNLSYGPNSVTVTETSVKTQTSPSGAVSPVSTSTSGQPLPSQPSAPAAPEIQTCGYPGGPACKIDETGTPEPLPVGKYTPAADEYKTKADENRTTIGGNGDKPFFSGWNVFFFAPPLAACQPFQLPTYNGSSMGALDACNVVEGTRSVMSYIWALAALLLCLGMIKREV